MHIYVNARFLTQRPTGVERYAYEICLALVKTGASITLVCPSMGKIDSAYDISRFNIRRFGVGASHFWEQLVFPWYFIGKKDYVVLSFTGLGSILIQNKIMTVHDLSFLVNPSWFSKPYYYLYKVATPLALRTSKHIITVSQFSKKEIVRFYPFISPDRISVVYNAVNTSIFHVLPKRHSSDTPYFLAVSSIDQRKNFLQLLNVFDGIQGCTLKIVGGNNRIFNSSMPERNTPNNIEYLGRVSDAELVELYNEANAFIFPSLYEGFGLPPIEAMASGCPVLASDIPVLREVCGDAAIYFDPRDPSSIKNAIMQCLQMNDGDRQTIINKGKQNVTRYSWERSARKITELIKQNK